MYMNNMGIRKILSGAALLLAAIPVSASAQTRPPLSEGYVTTPDGAKLFYRIAGHARDTIIAIHGGPGVDLESIAGDFMVLAKKHTIIFYDQRGAGRSTLPKDSSTLNSKQQVLDLDAIRTHFKLAHVTLVAHSYGPLLAATYAIAHPDVINRMVFFGPVPPRRGQFNQRFGPALNARMDSASRGRMAAANRMLSDTTSDARVACKAYWAEAMRPRLAEPERTLPLVKSDLCASDPKGIRYGLRTTNRYVMGSYGDWDIRDSVKVVKAPVLIVHGDQEAIPMDMIEEWTTAFPNARLLKVPRAAHFTYAERPELVWPEVEKFLATPRR